MEQLLAALQSARLVKGSTLKVYPGAPHGMCTTLADQVNADLLAFLGGEQHADGDTRLGGREAA